MRHLPRQGGRRRLSATREVGTPAGPARLHLDGDPGGRLLLLGHGAGGGVESVDLLAARAAALGLGWCVVRMEQPYRVAGRRAPAPAAQLDAAFLAVCAALPTATLVTGGRSSGGRVACRTATAAGAAAVVALAFPLVPPTGSGASRDAELRQPSVPRLVVQGSRDAFGVPVAGPGVRVALVPGGDHAFRVRRVDRPDGVAGVRADIERAVAAFLQTVT
ncbi:MAG TPA: alpha/beta family hydrolase [Mycobacteriales bacterium]|nr:alpha/beta family hydrolase [Mycobacteriales bacterium]